MYLTNYFYEAPRQDSNLGPKAFSLLEIEIAPKTARPPRPVPLEIYKLGKINLQFLKAFILLGELCRACMSALP